MKILLLLGLFGLSNLALSQEIPTSGNSEELMNKDLKLYEVEKGTIEFSIEGQPGDTLITHFDRFGWRQVTLEFGEKLYYGIKTEINTREIVDGHTTFKLNLKDKKGKVSTDFTLSKLAAYKSPEELFAAQMAKIGAVMEGTDTLLDRECQRWTYQSRGKQLKIWEWNGIILKHISSSGTMTATALHIDKAVESDVFTVPNDMELVMN